MIKGEFCKFITQNVLHTRNRTLHLEKERAKSASFLIARNVLLAAHIFI